MVEFDEDKWKYLNGKREFYFMRLMFMIGVMDELHRRTNQYHDHDYLENCFSVYGSPIVSKGGYDLYTLMKHLTKAGFVEVKKRRLKVWRLNHIVSDDILEIIRYHMAHCEEQIRYPEICDCVYRFLNRTYILLSGMMYTKSGNDV